MIDLRAGDCRHVLASLPDASVDAVVTDPPYELGFMGKKWDGTGIAYDVGMWAEVLRVLKPGGHLLSFGGTRTWHRMACAVEDAGFEMRDSIAWLYGSGFPKSLDVGKAIDKAAGAEREVPQARHGGGDKREAVLASYGGRCLTCNRFRGSQSANCKCSTSTAPATEDAVRWDGWGTALKPAHEPIVVARKPLVGTVAANVVEHGTGALNIDACRIGTSEDTARKRSIVRTTAAPFGVGAAMGGNGHAAGRWPANVVLDETCADLLDEQSGQTSYPPAGIYCTSQADQRKDTAAPFAVRKAGDGFFGYGDRGGASRFFKRVDWSEGDSVVAWRQDRATTADNSSSQPRPADGSAPSDAATSASLAAKPSSSSQTGRPTTVATPSASRPNAETGTPAMPTTASASWQGQPPDEHSQTPSRARSAETPTLTGTTTTTPSRSPSGGSAANTTSAGTSSSTAPGVKVLDGADRFIYCAKAPTKERPRHDGTAHPTVKPLTLMRWLVRLVTPPGGTVLDPFTGSGTTLEAALLEGFHAIGIEANPDYLPLIRQRLARHDSTLFGATA